MVGDPGVLGGIGRAGVIELSLNRYDIAGFLYEVPAHSVAGVIGRVPPTLARLHTSLNTVLITRGLSRPSPWALVAGDRNSTGDFHFLKRDRVQILTFLPFYETDKIPIWSIKYRNGAHPASRIQD